MDAFWLVLNATGLAMLLGAFATLWWGSRRVTALADVPPPARDEPLPLVSIVAAARDESRNIETAVRSWLGLDYPALEIVVVDDRSEDATPAILARLAAQDARLRVVSVRELPDGWLGKNHALECGAGAARGELLLFTDADVDLEATALARAVAYLQRHDCDHVAASPETTMPGLMNAFTLYFGVLFSLYVRPWKARDPRSSAHVGIGAFNLVRREAFRRAGGMAPIRMRPDDDLKLGKLLKRSGARQDFVAGRGMVRVEWYASWRQLRDGLMKNLFAGAEYRVSLVTLGVLVHVGLLFLPAVSWLWTGGTARFLSIGCLALYGLQGWRAARDFGTRPWMGLTLPAFALFGAWLMTRATWLTLRQGGIVWRGRRYALQELRRNVV